MELLYGEDKADQLEWLLRGDGTAEIIDIVVGSERRVGRGRKLLERLFARPAMVHVQTVYAITRADNLIAQQFYESCGFEVTGVLRRFYDRENKAVDAIMYGRSPRGPV